MYLGLFHLSNITIFTEIRQIESIQEEQNELDSVNSSSRRFQPTNESQNGKTSPFLGQKSSGHPIKLAIQQANLDRPNTQEKSNQSQTQTRSNGHTTSDGYEYQDLLPNDPLRYQQPGQARENALERQLYLLHHQLQQEQAQNNAQLESIPPSAVARKKLPNDNLRVHQTDDNSDLFHLPNSGKNASVASIPQRQSEQIYWPLSPESGTSEGIAFSLQQQLGEQIQRKQQQQLMQKGQQIASCSVKNSIEMKQKDEIKQKNCSKNINNSRKQRYSEQFMNSGSRDSVSSLGKNNQQKGHAKRESENYCAEQIEDINLKIIPPKHIYLNLDVITSSSSKKGAYDLDKGLQKEEMQVSQSENYNTAGNSYQTQIPVVAANSYQTQIPPKVEDIQQNQIQPESIDFKAKIIASLMKSKQTYIDIRSGQTQQKMIQNQVKLEEAQIQADKVQERILVEEAEQEQNRELERISMEVPNAQTNMNTGGGNNMQNQGYRMDEYQNKNINIYAKNYNSQTVNQEIQMDQQHHAAIVRPSSAGVSNSINQDIYQAQTRSAAKQLSNQGQHNNINYENNAVQAAKYGSTIFSGSQVVGSVNLPVNREVQVIKNIVHALPQFISFDSLMNSAKERATYEFVPKTNHTLEIRSKENSFVSKSQRNISDRKHATPHSLSVMSSTNKTQFQSQSSTMRQQAMLTALNSAPRTNLADGNFYNQEDILYRNDFWIEHTKSHKKLLADHYAEEEMKECTFSPTFLTNNTTRKCYITAHNDLKSVSHSLNPQFHKEATNSKNSYSSLYSFKKQMGFVVPLKSAHN